LVRTPTKAEEVPLLVSKIPDDGVSKIPSTGIFCPSGTGLFHVQVTVIKTWN